MGPLDGIRVIELAGIGPGPYCAMLLSDLGADVLRVDRASAVSGADAAEPPLELLNRGRRSIGVDLKHPDGAGAVLSLVESADALIEGFRPGVAERLGIGPDECLARNPGLVYGRMTGWGQQGPLATTAGHDINYIAMSGVLHGIGPAGSKPIPPLNLVGDFGGGSMFLALGILGALVERHSSGEGQVVDAAMVDGSASLATMFHGMRAMGMWSDERGTNLLDTGAHFYDTYETADGKYVSVGAIEPQFYAELLDGLGLDPDDLPHQLDQAQWPAMKERFAAVFRRRNRDDWAELFAGSDACVAPVLSVEEAVSHAHNAARGTFVTEAGVTQPGPAPRLSRTPGAIQRPPAHPGQHTEEALRDWGFSADKIARLRDTGAVR